MLLHPQLPLVFLETLLEWVPGVSGIVAAPGRAGTRLCLWDFDIGVDFQGNLVQVGRCPDVFCRVFGLLTLNSIRILRRSPYSKGMIAQRW